MIMKPEEMSQKCPECGSTEKRISRRRNTEKGASHIPLIPEGDVGLFKCANCGHIFEYCSDPQPPIKVKKKLV